jgi:hypothetical protein
MDQRKVCKGCGATGRRLAFRVWRNGAHRLRATCLSCGKFAGYLAVTAGGGTAYRIGDYHVLDLLSALDKVGVEIRSFQGRIQWRGKVRESGHLLAEVRRRRTELLRLLRPCPAN